ncbi:MAG: uracil-DNA glycosylase [Thermoanaerobaculia bacterium]
MSRPPGSEAALAALERDVVACRACPRLVRWREAAGRSAPRRFAAESYWARPVPGFGDPRARLLVVGLAPAAHGGNRTGRVFTGDASGNFLFAALHRAGFANQALSVSRDDGLRLSECRVTAAARCAPPDNHPSPREFDRCRPFLVREIVALPRLSVLLALGELAFRQALRAWDDAGRGTLSPRPPFFHGARAVLPGGVTLIASYHVSRQNTNTGRLTAAMFDAVLRDVRAALT